MEQQERCVQRSVQSRVVGLLGMVAAGDLLVGTVEVGLVSGRSLLGLGAADGVERSLQQPEGSASDVPIP